MTERNITGLPTETLSTMLYPDHRDSPTVAHARAILCVAHGEQIPDEIKFSVVDFAERFKEQLEATIDAWNGGFGKTLPGYPSLNTIGAMKLMNLESLSRIMARSYGESGSERDRLKLLNDAIQLTATSIRRN